MWLRAELRSLRPLIGTFRNIVDLGPQDPEQAANLPDGRRSILAYFQLDLRTRLRVSPRDAE
eukprot:5639019-Pyramimonas_sp.AAC.1